MDSARGHFSIDETSGIVMLNRPLDREERATFNLTVQASDHGTPQLSSLATLLVVVQGAGYTHHVPYAESEALEHVA